MSFLGSTRQLTRRLLSVPSLTLGRTFPSRGTPLKHSVIPRNPIASLAHIRSLHTSKPLLSPPRYARFSPDPERPFDVTRWDRGTRLVVLAVVGGATYYVYHLERVPITNRLRFMDISPSREASLAQESYVELLQEFNGKILPEHHPVTIRVRHVVERLLERSDLGTLRNSSSLHGRGPRKQIRDVWGNVVSDDEAGMGVGKVEEREKVPGNGGKEWNLLVVDDLGTVNAMASFGNVVVFTGILKVCKDDQGLAAVLSHEIGHVVARHPSERLSQSKIFLALALLLESTLGIDYQLSKVITTLALELPGSRKQETEADTIGMGIATKACYDPEAAVHMHERLAKETGDKSGFALLRTHPVSETRIQHLKGLLPDAYAMRAAIPGCEGLGEQLEAFKSEFGGSGGGPWS